MLDRITAVCVLFALGLASGIALARLDVHAEPTTQRDPNPTVDCIRLEGGPLRCAMDWDTELPAPTARNSTHNALGGYIDACGELPGLVGDDC